MHFKFVSAIVRGKWAIDPHYAINAGPIISDFLNGKVLSESLPLAPFNETDEPDKKQQNGKVAIISITGPLLKDDGPCGEPGMATIGNIIRISDTNPAVKAIVLHIDSPGGTVDGTEYLANIIRNVRKPVVSWVDGQMASAALWIGTSAREVFASNEFDEVGSVGVLLSFADMRPAYEKEGIKFHDIVSSLSPDKLKWYEDLRAGNYEEYQKTKLDPIALHFQNVVKENRPGVKPEHLTGKVYFAKDVIGVFVDQIGTLEDAVMRALDLALADENNTLNKNEKRMDLKRISEVLGEDSLEFEADGRRTFTTEEMVAIESALSSKPDPSGDLSALQAALTEVQQRNESLAAVVSEQDEQIRNLMNAPAAEPMKPAQETDANPDSAGEYLTKEDIDLYMKIKR